MISQAGNDFQKYQRWLKQHHVQLDFVRVVQSDQTATAHIMTDSNDNQITGFYFGAMQVSVVPVMQHKIQTHLKAHDLAILAAGNLNDMLALVKVYQQKQVQYIFDPGQQLTWLTASQIKTVLKGATVLIVNDYELALIEKKLNITLKKLTQQLPYVIVTLGSKGADWYIQQKRYHFPIVKPKRAIDPTGAGDAYRAGVLCGLAAGWNVAVIGRVAALCATYCVEHYGTQTHHYSLVQFKKRYQQTFKQSLTI